MKILSIDVDYAFSPDISKYDDYVCGSSLSHEEEWKVLSDKGFSKPKVNREKLADLHFVYSQALKSTDQVFFIDHHHEIVSNLDSSICYDVVNFDHHHDIFYPGWHDKSVLDEGNWVNWLDASGLLSSYTWYRNIDSEDLDPSVFLSCQYGEKFYDADPLPQFDKVFVCSSPNWIHEDNIYVLDDFKNGVVDGKICL